MTSPSGTFLTPDELRELTGSTWRSRQIEWMMDNRWTYVLTRDGRPVILRAYAEKKLGMKETKALRWKPNLSAIPK